MPPVLKDEVEAEHHLVMRLQPEQWYTELAYLLLKPPAKHGIEGQKSQQFPMPVWAQGEPSLKYVLEMLLVQNRSLSTHARQSVAYDDIVE
jgi:hypothetical protein